MALNISRRDFLKTTSVAAAGATAASITPFSSAYARRDRISRVVIAKDVDCIGDQDRINDMVDYAIKELTEADTIPEAYEALFPEPVTTSTIIAIKQNSVSAGSSNQTWRYVRDALKNGLTKMLNGTFPENNVKVETSGSTNSSNPSFQIGNRTFGFRNPWVEADYIINSPVCWTHGGTYGCTLSLKNMMSSCSSHGDFHDFDYSYSSNPWQPILSSQPTAKNKQILVLMDAISARSSNGGPGGSANVTPCCVVASKDMVAADYQGIMILKENGLSSSLESAALSKLAYAAQSQYGLGTDNPDEMDVIEIEPPWDPVGIGSSKKETKLSSQVKVIKNPANSEVTFKFPLSSKQKAELTIFDMQGRNVWSYEVIGKSNIVWQVKDLNGKVVPNGMYVYNLKIGARTASGKVEISR